MMEMVERVRYSKIKYIDKSKLYIYIYIYIYIYNNDILLFEV